MVRPYHIYNFFITFICCIYTLFLLKGIYLFNSVPPFEVKYMSPAPIVAKEFYSGKSAFKRKINYIIFPMSIIVNEENILLFYGRNDKEAWLLTLNKSAVIASLIKVESK